MISVIVPMFNEADNVEKCIATIRDVLDKNFDDWELIAVDDGSNDGTYKKLEEAKVTTRNLKIFKHDINKGPGAAFRTGFLKANGDVIVTIDADLSFSPKLIPILVSELKDADLVIGSQHKKGAKIINVPLIRRIASKGANILDRIILGVNLSSLTSFFVAYRSKIIKNLRIESDSFDAQSEILTKLFWSGYRIKEIPAPLIWSAERKKQSKLKLFNEIVKRFFLWKRLLDEKNYYTKSTNTQ